MLTFPHSAEAVSVTYQSDFVLSRAYFFSNKAKFLFLPRHVSNNRDSTERQTDLLATYLDGWNTELSSDSKTRKLSTFFFEFIPIFLGKNFSYFLLRIY